MVSLFMLSLVSECQSQSGASFSNYPILRIHSLLDCCDTGTRNCDRIVRARFRYALSNAASCEASTEREPHNWPKAVCSRNADEIKAGYRRFEVRRKHRRIFDGFKLRPDLRAQEAQSSDIDFVPRRGDDVFGYNLSLGTVGRAKMKMYSAIVCLGADRCKSQYEWHPPHHFLFGIPSCGRTKMFS